MTDQVAQARMFLFTTIKADAFGMIPDATASTLVQAIETLINQVVDARLVAATAATSHTTPPPPEHSATQPA
jgi:DNA-binding NarL/FixJ family response regulator